MVFKAAINQSQVTLVHPNDPRNRCAENLCPFPLQFLEWGIAMSSRGLLTYLLGLLLWKIAAVYLGLLFSCVSHFIAQHLLVIYRCKFDVIGARPWSHNQKTKMSIIADVYHFNHNFIAGL